MEAKNKPLETVVNEVPNVECGIIKEDSLLKNLGYNFLPLAYAAAKGAAGLYAVENIENPWIKGISAAYFFGSALLEGIRFMYVIPNVKDKQMVRSGLIPIEAIVAHNLKNYKRMNEYLDENFKEEKEQNS